MHAFITRLSRRLTAIMLAGVASIAPLHASAATGTAPTPPHAIEDHTATANGVSLHYLQAGQGPGTPVVLLHGYAETSRMWRPLITQLADRRVVIAPDLRGAGGSPNPPPATTRRPWPRTSMRWCAR